MTDINCCFRSNPFQKLNHYISKTIVSAMLTSHNYSSSESAGCWQVSQYAVHSREDHWLKLRSLSLVATPQMLHLILAPMAFASLSASLYLVKRSDLMTLTIVLLRKLRTKGTILRFDLKAMSCDTKMHCSTPRQLKVKKRALLKENKKERKENKRKGKENKTEERKRKGK